MTRFIYLHGFASSPDSNKAAAFKKHFLAKKIPLMVPDLEGGDFENITLTRQFEIVEGCLDRFPGTRCALIGSSMGGYLAALAAQLRQEVAAIYLLAPGFEFISRWREKIGRPGADSNGQPEFIRIFHYRYNKEVNLSGKIFEDAPKWEQMALDRKLPTRIVHGIHDDAVPIEVSRKFARDNPWTRLVELDADHGLLSEIDWIVQDCLDFFHDEKLL